jgi:hypothetical protein
VCNANKIELELPYNKGKKPVEIAILLGPSEKKANRYYRVLETQREYP